MRWLTSGLKVLEKKAFTILIIWVIILAFLYSLLSLLRHEHFQSGGFDLGLYDQAVWQYSRFIWPYNTIKERFILGDHLTLTLPLLAPLYWIWNDVRLLLIFQAFWIAFSAIAVYKLTLCRRLRPWVGLSMSFIYSLFYGIQYGVFFDFHPVIIGVGLLVWLIYFLEAKKKTLFVLTLMLLLLTQENMGLAVVSLGLIYIWKKPWRKTALLFIFGGLLFSAAAVKVVALFSPVGFQYWPQLAFSPAKIFWQFFDSSEKRQVWFYSLASFSFLPLFSFGAMSAVLLDLAQYFVTGPEFARMWSPFMHHRAILAPYLTLGTLEVLEFLRRKKISPAKVALLLVLLALLGQYAFHHPLNKLTKPIYWQKSSWMSDNQALFKYLPAGASLATQQNLIPHLSHRREVHLVWPRPHDFPDKRCGQISCWWLDFGGRPQYLVVDLRPDQWLTQILETNANFQAAVANMEKAGKIKLEKEVNSAKLYRISY